MEKKRNLLSIIHQAEQCGYESSQRWTVDDCTEELELECARIKEWRARMPRENFERQFNIIATAFICYLYDRYA